MDDDEATRLVELLSADERARSDALRFERHRRRYVAGRGRLRELLAAYADAEPRALVLVERANGKPELEGHELRFNLAHSEAVGICAVSAVEVGVDVEVVDRRRRPQWRAVGERFFHPDEVALVRGVTDEAGWLEFLRIWTLKEACLKAVGVGLLTDPRAFSVAEVLAGEDDAVTLAGERWLARELKPSGGALAALAVSG